AQEYIVSFVAGPSGLGLVAVTITDSAIGVGQPSITQMNKILGSTAVDAYMGYWDYGLSYYVWTINGGVAERMKVDRIQFGEDLRPYEFGKSSQIPGQYQPIHLFRENEIDRGGGGIPDSTRLLTTGNGISGTNDYVSSLLFGGAETKIFTNPANRSAGTAAIAPDGRLVSQMTFQGLNHIGLIGRLIDGELVRSPTEWLNVNAFQGYSQSLTNPIRGNGQKSSARYLAYRNFRKFGTSKIESQVMIQNVDATTGKPEGSPRAITKFARAMNVEAEKLQSIVISPDGGLILYTAWDNVCNKQILWARKLVKGSSFEYPKVIVGCRQLEEYPAGVYGINIGPACPRIDYHSFCP
ncbi:hypothetical protein L0244_00285, partial [bacterium]|nr:hypothetical protein [bacterium]